MSTFTKIIVGDDGLAGGEDAVALTRSLAPEAEVILASAYPWDNVPSRFTQLGYGNALREDTEKGLAARRAASELANVRTVAIPDTSPAHALHHLAEAEHADLLVVGSAHHGTIGRRILGDVGRGLLHGAPCPVLVAPRGYAGHAAAPQTIGVAFDQSPEARHALAVAVALAADTGARVTVRQVVALEFVPAFGAYPVIDVEQLTEDLRADAQSRMDEVVATLGTTVAIKAEVVAGATYERLDELAAEADLVVCGSRGWGAFRRVMVGSTSDHLVHHAPCPVLVVPGAAESEHGTVAGAAQEPATA